MDPALRELLRIGTGESQEIEAIIRLESADATVPGVRIVSRFGPIATCRLNAADVPAIRHYPGVQSLKAPRLISPGDQSPGAPESHRMFPSDERRPSSIPLTGKGVVVGIVDWGCDFRHADFRHDDGLSRLLALWDQRDGYSQSPPEPYGYGRVFPRHSLDEALREPDPYSALDYYPADADRDGTGSHGTHVMGIAAGNGRGGGPVGIAPEADIVFVHLANRDTGGLANLGQSSRILEAVSFIAETAGNRPWVINLSVGRHGGPHDGCTLVELAFDHLLQEAPGRFIVQSTGNYFDKCIHASDRLVTGEQRVLRLDVDRADITPNELEVWYAGEDYFAVRTESPSGTVSDWTHLDEQTSIIENGDIVGRLYNRAADPNNGDNHIDLFLYQNARPGEWRVTLRAIDTMDGRFHAWLERDSACPGCQTRFVEPDCDNRFTTGTLANSRMPIVVGAYDAHEPAFPPAQFSSIGPTRDGRDKPDIVAPGVGILSARSATGLTSEESSGYVRKSGTSMAAPHVAGAVALALQGMRHPLSSDDIRRLVLGTAHPGRAGARLGNGYLDLQQLVNQTLVAAGNRRGALRETVLPDTASLTRETFSMNTDTDIFESAGQPTARPVYETTASRAVGVLPWAAGRYQGLRSRGSPPPWLTPPPHAFSEQIHSGTFSGARERRGRRRGLEIEATLHLVCLQPGNATEAQHLYQLLSRNDWRAFRRLSRCASCAAFSSQFDINDMPWDQDSHALRERNPYVWLSIERGRFDPNETRLNRKVDFGTDLNDDFYFDNDQFTLLNNNFVLRGRKRWDNWRLADAVRLSRLLIANKQDTGVGSGGIKSGRKEDIRLDRADARQSDISGLVTDIQSGFFRWPRNNRRRRVAIGPVKTVYNALQRAGHFSTFQQGGQTHVFDIKPKAFIRSLRRRYHLSETSLRALERIQRNGRTRLETLRDRAQAAIAAGSLTTALQTAAQDFLDNANQTLNYDRVATRARAQILNLHPRWRISTRRVRSLRPRRRGGRPPSHRETQKQKVVADTISVLYHELANELLQNRLVDAISSETAATHDIWLRQIEAGGSAGQGLWFDKARRYYVRASTRAVNADFLIDTLDASGMFTPNAWAGTTAANQTNQQEPDITRLFHATLANEIQIELGRERAYVDRIEDLEGVIRRAGRATQTQQDLLDGAKFILERYRQAMTTLADMKSSQITRGIQREIQRADNAGRPFPKCGTIGWQPVTQGKGETALTILNAQPTAGSRSTSNQATVGEGEQNQSPIVTRIDYYDASTHAFSYIGTMLRRTPKKSWQIRAIDKSDLRDIFTKHRKITKLLPPDMAINLPGSIASKLFPSQTGLIPPGAFDMKAIFEEARTKSRKVIVPPNKAQNKQLDKLFAIARKTQDEHGFYLTLNTQSLKMRFVRAVPTVSTPNKFEAPLTSVNFRAKRRFYYLPQSFSNWDEDLVVGMVHTHYLRHESGIDTTTSRQGMTVSMANKEPERLEPRVSNCDMNDAYEHRYASYAIADKRWHKAMPSGKAFNEMKKNFNLLADALESYAGKPTRTSGY